LRSTAQKYGYYNPPVPGSHVTTSVVRQNFHDFDQTGYSVSEDEEQERSIEVGRGHGNKNVRNTPSKLGDSNSDLRYTNALLSIGNDSLYELTGTPPVRPRVAARKSDGVERGSLRREALNRRASSVPQKDIEASISRISTRERISPAKTAKGERHKSTLAEMHARVSEDDGSFVGEQRPATVTANVRNSRFGKPGSRQASDAAAGPSSDHRNGQTLTTRDRAMTPQAERVGTPRTANATAQSFMLPDLPNLTELMSGVYQDGTPVFSRSAKAKSRFTSGSYPRQGGTGGPARYQLDSVPVSQEEKAIFASLHLLKEKVAQLEQDKTEAEQQIGEYENEVIELRARLEAQENQRRSDSALGSSDEESKKKIKWQAEKTSEYPFF
ncbi:hypothetical protein LTS18_012775, partial [Coniosporium uncinatum]